MTGKAPFIGPIVGILGGGQLGRMMALAGHRIGIRTRILDPDPDCPAGQVTDLIAAPFDDDDALQLFAQGLYAVTLEFENVPVTTLEKLEAMGVPCAPGAKVLRIAQDRVLEKKIFAECQIPTASWHRLGAADDIASIPKDFTFPAILKTCRMGYDGKGQTTVDTKDHLEAAWLQLGQAASILEEKCDFKAELSVILARNKKGDCVAFEPARNQHVDGILRSSCVPSGFEPTVCERAIHYAQQLARKLDLHGLLATEFFVMQDDTVLANELAPRPHNSGHWTMDGAMPCQFEMALIAACNHPLPQPIRYAPIWMVNLIGEDICKDRQQIGDRPARLHLYGKSDIRPGRKMGHINFLAED